MGQRLTSQQRELALEALKEFGTIKSAALAAGVDVKKLYAEMKRSAIFMKRMIEAKQQGHHNIADNAIELIIDYSTGKYEKTDRNRLTAAIALANAFVPGFRGVSRIESNVQHDFRIITGIPRPKYIELPESIVKITEVDTTQKLYDAENKAKLKMLNRGEYKKKRQPPQKPKSS